MLRVVVDPNVLVSAAIQPSGTPGRLVRAAFARRFVIVACPHLLTELERVLHRPKFRRYLTADEAREFVEAVAGMTEMAPDPAEPEALTRDPSDDYLVALARSADVDRIVSGDTHLLELGDAPPPVVTPRRFLDEVREATP